MVMRKQSHREVKGIGQVYAAGRASLVAQWQRIHLPMQETQVPSLGWEDPLEKEMATHSNILARGNPKTGGAWQDTVYRVAKELDTTQ